MAPVTFHSGDRKRQKHRAVRELRSDRTALLRAFANDDGTITIQNYLTPIFHKTHRGWVPIHNDIVRRGHLLETTGNAWRTAFDATKSGMKLSAPEGTVRIVPVGPRGNARPDVISSPNRLRFRSARGTLAHTAIPPAGLVGYRGVWRDVDLRYEVSGNGLKENIQVRSSKAPAAYAFDVLGAILKADKRGGLALAGPLGRRFYIPALMVRGADGSLLTSPSRARYGLTALPHGKGTRVTVTLDQWWLRSLPNKAFPLDVDPTFGDCRGTVGECPDTNAITLGSNGFSSSNTTVDVGRDSSGNIFRAAMYFQDYETWLKQDYRVYDSQLALNVSPGVGTLTVADQGSNDPTSPTWTYTQLSNAGVPIVGTWDSTIPGSSTVFDATNTVDQWYAGNLTKRWFGITGTETGSSNTEDSMNGFLTLDVYFQPAASRVTNLTANQILSTTTPSLQAFAIQPAPNTEFANGGYEPIYDYEITTSPVPGKSIVASSGDLGCSNSDPGVWSCSQDTDGGGPIPTWNVPPGALQDGVTYYAWVLTDWSNRPYALFHDGAPETTPPASWGVPFKVDLGLGNGGNFPTDAVGAVPGSAQTPSEGAPNPALPPSKVTVNLVDGNAAIAVDNPKLETVSGGAQLRFTYNSLATAQEGVRGLQGDYYNDTNGNGTLDPGTDALVAERTDPSVWFNTGFPVQGIVDAQSPAKALAEWTGFLTLPNSDSWEIGDISSDGVTATVNGVSRLSDFGPHAAQPKPTFGTSFAATPQMPIKIDWHHSSGRPSVIAMYAKDMATCDANGNNCKVYALDPSWLTRAPKTLPAGWAFNSTAATAQWTRLVDHGDLVTLYADDGTGHVFTRASGGRYVAPPETPQDLLTNVGNGQFNLVSGGYTYTFGPTGDAISIVTTSDDLHPAAPQHSFTGTPPLLHTITDPVRCAGAVPCPSSSQVSLNYGGDAGAPAECNGAPSGMLCYISYFDASATIITYDSFGNLSRIIEPGNVVYDFAYDSLGRVTDVRDPLAYNAIQAGVRVDDATAKTHITYDSSSATGRVQTITQPAPAAGGARPERLYCYGSAKAYSAGAPSCNTAQANTTSVGVYGFNPTVGYAYQEQYDSRNRKVASFDSAGLKTSYTWDDKDRQVTTVDPAGLETSTIYDALGHAVTNYGPAAKALFNADGTLITPGSAPTTQKTYDGGITGLAASWYPTTDLSGSAAYHTTSNLADTWSGACNSPSACNGGGTVIPASGFSGDLSGKVTLPSPGRISFDGDGGRVLVDGHLVVDQKDGPLSAAVRADHPLDFWRLADATGSTLAADSSGALAGTYSPSGTTRGVGGPASGDNATAATFDGTAGNITIPDDPTLRFDRLQPFSVEAWIKTSSATTQVIASKLPNAGSGWELDVSSGKLLFLLTNSYPSNTIQRSGSVTLTDGNWHHVAVTYDGSSTAAGVTFYEDGVADPAPVTNVDTLTSDPRGTSGLNIGSRPADGFFFNGTIADVAVYNQQVSAARIAAHKAAAALLSSAAASPIIYNSPYPTAVDANSPTSFWRLGEASGTTATDSNGSSNGMYTGSVTLNQPGPIPGDPSTSAIFGGGTGTVSVPDSPALRVNQSQPFSVEAWVKTTTSSQMAIASKMPGTGSLQGWEFGLASGKPYLTVINTVATNWIDVAASTSVVDGRWHHLVGTYDGSSRASGVHLYIDGHIDGGPGLIFGDSLSASSASSVPLYIGSRAANSLWFFGNLANVAMYPNALGADDVARHAVAGQGPVPLTVQQDGAASYWRLGESLPQVKALDMTGANNATYSPLGCGQTTGGLNGDANGATTFDGTNCNVSVGEMPSLRVGRTQAASIEAWVKTTAAVTQVIAAKMANTSPFTGWDFVMNPSGQLYFQLISSWTASAIEVDGTKVLKDGAWHHVAATYDGSGVAAGVKLYADGVADTVTISHDTLGTTNPTNSSNPFTIGSRATGLNFNGSMSDVAFYDRALSSDQVANHRNAGITAPPAPVTDHRIDVQDQQFVAGGHLTVTSAAATFGPNYGLLTQTTDPDGKITQTQYADAVNGIDPKFGLPTATIQDPSTLNLKTSTAYEPPGATSFLRRVSKTLPAGNQTTYANYAGNDPPIANVCGVTASTLQAGLPKQETDPVPAVGSARVEQYVYDSLGREAGHRIGTTATISSVGWDCTTYDAAGRMVTQSWPAFGSQPSRTATYTYGVGSPTPNPLVNSVTDTTWPAQSISTTVDLLGRTVSYSDIWGQTTTTTFDQAGRVTDTAGPVGARHTDYDGAGRVSDQMLGAQKVAVPGYDAPTGRMTSVSYPTGTGNGGNGSNLAIGYDANGRQNSLSATGPGSALITSDSDVFSAGARVSSETIDGNSGSPSSFGYDGAGRLTTATVPGHTLTYNYAATGGCGPEAAAGNNTNRTSVVDGATTTTYCYDNADRLTSTSDARYTTPTYDDHGNTSSIGDETITYDAADRHLATTTTGGALPTTVNYLRDPLDRIAERDATVIPPLGRRTPGTIATTSTTVTSIAVPKPAGTVSGDFLLADISERGTPTITPPSGWTLLNSTASGTTVTDAVYYKVAGSSEPASYTFSFSTATSATGAIMGYVGVDTTNPIDTSGVVTDTNVTSHTAPAVTTTSPDDMLLVILASDGNSTVTKDAQTTQQWFLKSAAASNNVESDGADQVVTKTGSTGTRSVTTATAQSSVVRSIALKSRPVAPIAFRDVATATTGASILTPLVVPRPAKALPGDLLVADVSLVGAPTITTPPGWTALPPQVIAGLLTDEIFYKVATSSEPTSYSFAFSAATSATGAITAYSGVDPLNPIDVSAVATDGSTTTTHTAPSVTTTSPADTALFILDAAGNSAVTPDAQTTQRWNLATTAATNVQSNGADQLIAAAGATGTRTIKTATAARGIMRSIALRPQAVSRTRYGYEGHDDSPSLEMDGAGSIIDRTVSLAGGVVVTRTVATATSTDTWSYPNVHGDVAATANGSGAKVGSTLTYDPYGQPLAGNASDTSSNFSFGWEGSKEKLTEHQDDIATIEMGARQYVSGLGRFLSVDPVEGGCANAYVFAFGDPVSYPDLNGLRSKPCSSKHHHGLGFYIGVAVVGGFVAGAAAAGSVAAGGAAIATVASAVLAGNAPLIPDAVSDVARAVVTAATFLGGAAGAVGTHNEICNGQRHVEAPQP